MDSKHRHELKTNELAEWIEHVPQFFKDNIRTIVGVTLIIIAFFTWPMFSKKAKKADLEGMAGTTALIAQVERNKIMALQSSADSSTMPASFLITANSLDIAAGDKKAGAALALINRGEALRADLHYRSDDVPPDVLVNQIDQSRASYEQAIDQAEGNSTIVAMAEFGLGLCAEEIGDFIKAEEIYRLIISNSEYEGTVFPTRAQFRLDIMPDSRENFTFVESSQPADAQEQEESTQVPSTQQEVAGDTAESADAAEATVPEQTETPQAD